MRQQAARLQRRASRHLSSPEVFQAFKRARNIFKAEVKKAKAVHTAGQLESADRFNFWTIYRKATSAAPLRRLPPLRNDLGHLSSNVHESVDLLKDAWFSSHNNISPPSTTPPSLASHYRRPSQRLTLAEISQAVFESEPLSAVPDQSYPAIVIQKGWDVLGPHLLALFSACLRIGHHPSVWKHAQVTPVPKPGRGDYSIPKAYRPITLLPVTTKIFEKVLAHRPTSYGLSGALPAQHLGGLPGRGREHAVLMLTEEIQRQWS